MNLINDQSFPLKVFQRHTFGRLIELDRSALSNCSIVNIGVVRSFVSSALAQWAIATAVWILRCCWNPDALCLGLFNLTLHTCVDQKLHYICHHNLVRYKSLLQGSILSRFVCFTYRICGQSNRFDSFFVAFCLFKQVVEILIIAILKNVNATENNISTKEFLDGDLLEGVGIVDSQPLCSIDRSTRAEQ